MADVITRAFRELYGKPCWNAHQGYGASLRFEFGQPHLKIREFKSRPGQPLRKKRMANVHGEWHLWIYCCDWTIAHHGKQLATNESSDRKIEMAAAWLNSQALTDVSVDPKHARTVFVFDDGGRLETHPWRTKKPYEQWLLYRPNKYVLTVRSDGTYGHHHHHTKPDKERWFRLAAVDGASDD